jgi:hypothetical protein
VTTSADEEAAAILTAHQRQDSRSCLCGWSKLGASHARHQVAALRAAGLLADVDPLQTRPSSPDLHQRGY